MKETKSLEDFRKIGSRREWTEWLENYHKNKPESKLEGDFFMDRFSIYDFARSEIPSFKSLVAFEEFEEYFVLKDEYC